MSHSDITRGFDAEGGDPREATLNLIRERLPDISFPYQ